ncbi:MAG: transporter [Pseudomonadota bacterium]
MNRIRHPRASRAASPLCAALLSCALAAPALADHNEGGGVDAKSHAPIGVMGDHLHAPGEVMFSFRYMRMGMEGSRIGTDPVAPETIATTVPNRFFGAPGQPPTLRVVPTDMTMDMYMLGAMVGLTERVTLMVMGQVIEKEMNHLTFAGPAGPDLLGEFQTKSSGFGDTKIAALVGLFDQTKTGGVWRAHLNLGLSLPTGSIGERDQILTPTGATPSPRLPYPMQIGSGTVDLEPGITIVGETDRFAWGAQYRATVRLDDNEAGYTHGDAHIGTAWAQWGPTPAWAFSVRAEARAQDAIDGIDPMIVAPVQTANPDFQGGTTVMAGPGANYAVQSGPLRGHRLAVEALFPLVRDLNGPQLETDWTLTLGWQKTF